MQILLRRLTEWSYREGNPARKWRTSRFDAFLDCIRPPAGARIVDLGGTHYFWNLRKHSFDVTLVNLPDQVTNDARNDSSIRLVEADATELSRVFADQSFDVVFSNSVIEHVGDDCHQAAFAREVQRLAPAFWVQTPSDRFPVEVHTSIPYYWKLPRRTRNWLNEGWKRKLPDWQEMISQTRVLSRQRMLDLFPTAQVYTERVALLEKSYAAYRPFAPPPHVNGNAHR